MALGAGGASYSPPRAIAALKKRWELLPAVWASPNDLILASDTESTSLIKSLITNKRIEIVGCDAIRGLEVRPEPWGWNLALRNELARLGVANLDLPDSRKLKEWRELAHRKTTLQFHQLWRETFGECLTEFPRVCCLPEDALKAIAKFDGEACMKLPWSSSGRGIWFTHCLTEAKISDIVRGAIKRQGAVIIEKAERVVFDFASEWECANGDSRFIGYSVFQTERAGYSGNLSASQEEIKSIIESAIGCDAHILVEKQRKVLNKIVAPRYEGPLGVDMFYTDDGRINPCVEINLRRTMGHAAMSWWEETGIKGLFPTVTGL